MRIHKVLSQLLALSCWLLIFLDVTGASSKEVWKCTGPLSKLDNAYCQTYGHEDVDACYYIEHFSQFRSCSSLCNDVVFGSIKESQCLSSCPGYFSSPNNTCDKVLPGELTTDAVTSLPVATKTAVTTDSVFQKPKVGESRENTKKTANSTATVAGTVAGGVALTVGIVFAIYLLHRHRKRNLPPNPEGLERGMELRNLNPEVAENMENDTAETRLIPSYSETCTDTNSNLDSNQYLPNPCPVTPTQESCMPFPETHSPLSQSPTADTKMTADIKLTVDITPNINVTSHSCASTSASHCPPAGSCHAERDRSLTNTPLSFASSSQTDSSGNSRADTPVACTGEFSEQDPGPPLPHQTPTFDPVAPSSPVDSQGNDN